MIAVLARESSAPQGAITFRNLVWGSTRRSVRGALRANGLRWFAATPDDFYRGRFDADGVTVECVFTPDDPLAFVRVVFDRQSGAAAILAATKRRYGNPVSCDAGATRCRWERGDPAVTYETEGDPHAPPGQASLEYTAGGSLAAAYSEQTNDSERDNDRSGFGSRHIP